MPDLKYWKNKVGELSNRRLSLKERAEKATGKEKQRLQTQIEIIDMDLDRAMELLNESRGVESLAR